jgi:ABC-type dipeptide/oligopeptide/nickel transport system ATPase component
MAENTPSANSHFRFFHNAETRLYIETAKEQKESIFSSIYTAFFSELNEKLADMKKDGDNSRNNLNNIFAFVGDRGSGKTSCMLSVAKMLEKNSDNAVVDKNTSFKVLDSTDPSFFDDKTNILDIFLGHLFGDFKTKWEKGDQSNIIEKNDLLESFEKVKQTISCLNTKGNERNNCISAEDNVDKLLELSASVNLANDIQNLIQKYLKFCKKDILVVPIDDIDLHSSCAYKMVEQIRKYLVQKNVVILMALKIEQLDKVVEKAYLKEFDDLIKKELLQTNQIAAMAYKYLIKLIPDNQRFALPTIEIMYNKIVDIYEQYDSTTDDTIEFLNQKWKKNDSYSGYPAKYIIVKLIFSKTRYLFYHMQGATNFIVPRTLREYNQLLKLLFSMPDYRECNSEPQKQYNKDLFKQYFVQSWCRSNLKEQDAAFIRQLFAITDVSAINKTAVQMLRNKFEDVFGRKSIDAPRIINELTQITNEKNKLYNISVGDVNRILQEIKTSLNNTYDQALIFALETFYSIRLYEYYDLKTETYLRREKTDIEKKVRIKSNTDDLSEYEILVGGSFYNINSKKDRVISANESIRRDHRVISLKTIRKFLDSLLSKEKLNDKELNTFRLIELFALLIQRRVYELDNRYRTMPDVVYASEFIPNQNNVWFNILSFFSNLIDVERCYNRIDK